jgi:hypothetical protein
MSQMDLQSEQFMTLLTDALRAGPGSPEWHQAVGVLRASGSANGADEYQLLVRAREDLESGKDYRSVTAGAGFTRKVMREIEEDGGNKGKGLPSANLIALLAAAVVLAVVVVIAVVLFRNAPKGPDQQQIEQLRSLYFVNTVGQLNFEGGDAAFPPGQEWKMVGEVPLRKRGEGVGPSTSTTQPSTKEDKPPAYRAGALVRAESVGPEQAMMVDVTFRAARATDAVIPQVFVSEGPVDAAKGTSGRELVWLMKNGTMQVLLPDLSVPRQAEKVDLRKPTAVNVKVRFDKETVIVDVGDKRLYEGPHKLSASAPRYVGVRFLRKVGDGQDAVWLTSINVLKP